MQRLAPILWLCVVSAAWGQVEIVRTITIHCRTPFDEGSRVSFDWYGDPGLTLTPIGNGSAATPSGDNGTYNGVVVATVDGTKTATAFSVSIGDTPPPPPPESLRDLIRNEAEANSVANYLRAFAGEVPSLRTAEEFWALFDAAFPAPDNAELLAALHARIGAAIEQRPKEVSRELLTLADEIAREKPEPIPAPDKQPTAITYVYEKDDSTVPSQVLAALDKLNRERGILATVFEEDTTDADGDVPKQYKVPLAAARQAGLPALVATKEDEVLKVIRDPRTEAQVWSLAP